MPQVMLRDKMKKAKPMVSILIITYNRKEDLAEVLEALLKQKYSPLEIIVIDNNSTDGTDKMFDKMFNMPHIRYFKMSENLGVSGGRNVAIDKAKGDILITIDDDAVLENPEATNMVVTRLISDPEVGVLMFKIVNYFTGNLQKNAFPCRNKKADSDSEFETTWFIGAGHAIARNVYESIGLYREFRPWGSEDFDYSLRVIDAGLKIVYFPQVVVRHKISESGRIANFAKFRGVALKHRLKAAILNLPWYSVITMSIVRSVQLLIMTRGNLFSVVLVYYWLVRDLPKLVRDRRVISRKAVKKLRELKGPLYY